MTRSDSGTVAISISNIDWFDFDWIQQLIAHAPESGSTGKRDLGAEAGAAQPQHSESYYIFLVVLSHVVLVHVLWSQMLQMLPLLLLLHSFINFFFSFFLFID